MSLDHDGAFALRQDLVRRWGRVSLQTALADGSVTRVAPGLYALTARAGEFATRVNVANAWMPSGAAIGGVAALALHQLTDLRPSTVTVVAPAPCHPRAPEWINVKRMQREIKTVRRFGVACQSPPDALIQAWAELPRESATTVFLEAMRRSRVSGCEIGAVLEQAPRVRDRRALEALLAQSQRGIESFLEYRADRTILNTSDLRQLPRQVPMRALGTLYTLDAYHASTRTAIEFDGASHHAKDSAFQRDRERDSALATLGILTLRFTYEDVMTRPRWVRKMIRATLRARAGGTQLAPRAA